MARYKIKNWHDYQHYKDRCPPWIKLHHSLLTSEVWVMCDDATRALAIASMLLASRNNDNDGTFNGDPEYIKRFAYLNSIPNFNPLIEFNFIEVVQDASALLAKCNTEQSRAEKRREDIKPLAEKRCKSAAVSIKTFMEKCRGDGVRFIPEDDPVFEFAEKNQIPVEMVKVCWNQFVRQNSESGKRQADWRKTFRNCVRGNWYKLWYIEADGTCKETSQYRAIKNELGSEVKNAVA